MTAPASPRGRFVTLEGIEGVGKSTNLDFVAAHLRAAGLPVVVTREPGGTPAGEELRSLLLRPDMTIDGVTEILMVFAARAAHIEQVIEPALAAGKWVVCDRFTDATYAYQGAGRGIADTMIRQLEELVQGGLKPDLTLLLDVPLEISSGRQQGRDERDRFEREESAFFERVRRRYLELAAREPERIRLIDASRSLPDVQRKLAAALATLIARR